MVELTALEYSLLGNGGLLFLFILTTIGWIISARKRKNNSEEVKQIIKMMREHHDNHKFLFARVDKYIRRAPHVDEKVIERMRAQ